MSLYEGKKNSLTEDQQIAVDAIVKFLKDYTPGNDFFTLQGLAGSGKTFSIVEALRSFKGSRIIIGGTISHSAKGVLESSLSDIEIPCYTVAQLLNMKQEISDKGKIEFVPDIFSKPSPINNADIIVIDECSMIDRFLFDNLASKKSKNAKIIYIGDPFQLAPINDSELDSHSFEHTKGKLHKPVRYTGPIMDLGSRLRQEIHHFNEGKACSKFVINEWMRELDNVDRTSCVDENGSGYIFLNNYEDAIRIAVQEFGGSDDVDSIRLIAFTNKVVDHLNDSVRASLYAGMEEEDGVLPQLVEGELIISDGGYNTKQTSVIYNNQVFKVLKTHKTTHPETKLGLISPLLDPEPKFPNGVWNIVPILDKKRSGAEFDESLNDLKNIAKNDGRMWRKYYNYKQQFAWFDYNYALTSHRSQGRTFQDVIVFEKDILEVGRTSTKIKLQSLYVACTRAKRRVYIFNSSYRVNQENLPADLRKQLGI